jgi:hypothetical protein
MSVDRAYEFGPRPLNAGGRLLFRGGQRLALSPKAVDLLIALAEAQANALRYPIPDCRTTRKDQVPATQKPWHFTNC